MIDMKKIKKLTKSERLKIYRMALNYILDYLKQHEDYPGGFCAAICIPTSHDEIYHSPFGDGIEKYYPELYVYHPKTKKYQPYWWDTDIKGTIKRIKILTTIISEMEKRKKPPIIAEK
jgi:hypothetical protein